MKQTYLPRPNTQGAGPAYSPVVAFSLVLFLWHSSIACLALASLGRRLDRPIPNARAGNQLPFSRSRGRRATDKPRKKRIGHNPFRGSGTLTSKGFRTVISKPPSQALSGLEINASLEKRTYFQPATQRLGGLGMLNISVFPTRLVNDSAVCKYAIWQPLFPNRLVK